MLSVSDLRVSFKVGAELVQAVDGVSFTIKEGRKLGLVGESGCGKTVTALSLLNLTGPGAMTCGQVNWQGRNVLTMSESDLRAVRGAQISMIFQNPVSSLNPVFTVGQQVMDVLILHRRMSRQEARVEVLRLFDRVKIPAAAKRFSDYPHQFSGGMCQRIMIAMAIAASPRLLIADEPTASLDVTIQAQIIELLNELNRDLGMSVLMISHDLGVISHICEEVAIMYLGRIVERGSVDQVFGAPVHPYTEALLASVPSIQRRQSGKVTVLGGDIPSPINLPIGCRFAGRCSYAKARCQCEYPPLVAVSAGQEVACFYPLG